MTGWICDQTSQCGNAHSFTKVDQDSRLITTTVNLRTIQQLLILISEVASSGPLLDLIIFMDCYDCVVNSLAIHNIFNKKVIISPVFAS
jgi:hypothetical protein